MEKIKRRKKRRERKKEMKAKEKSQESKVQDKVFKIFVKNLIILFFTLKDSVVC